MKITTELPNFSRDEFSCRCCGFNNMNHDFLVKLQMCRTLADVPFIITSGSRCPEYNKFVGGKENSEHLTGEAADIKAVDSHSRFKILQTAFDVGFKRIGIGANYIHLGMGKELPQQVVWHYYQQV